MSWEEWAQRAPSALFSAVAELTDAPGKARALWALHALGKGEEAPQFPWIFAGVSIFFAEKKLNKKTVLNDVYIYDTYVHQVYSLNRKELAKQFLQDLENMDVGSALAKV